MTEETTEETTQEPQELDLPKYKASEMPKLQFGVTRTQYLMLNQLAEAKDMPFANLCREAVSQYISDHWAREVALYSSTKT